MVIYRVTHNLTTILYVGYSSSLNCSLEMFIEMECINSDLLISCDLKCDGTEYTFYDNVTHNSTLDCISSGYATVQTECSLDAPMCSTICDNNNPVTCACTLSTNTSCGNNIPTSTTTQKPTEPRESSKNNIMTSTDTSPKHMVSSADTSTSMFISTGKSDTMRTSLNSDITPILLSIIIVIMALFICLTFATLLIRRLRKRKRTHTINGRDLIHQENIYQIVDGNRRPSRIIPIVTHGGERLEMTEFPRYNDTSNHHKLSNASLSVSCEKGGFLTSQVVPMATASYPNGHPPQHLFSANKVSCKQDQNPLHSESYFPAPSNYHQPVHGSQVQVHITHSSQSSLTDDIDPYSTLDEARNEALVEIRSTHAEEHSRSDDVLMLNMFGSDKPKWSHDTRPLHLNVPTNSTSRNVNGRLSLGDDEDNQYIHMNGGDLEGGWGECRSRAHRRGFDATEGLPQALSSESNGDFGLSENAYYNRPIHMIGHPPEEQRGDEVETDEAPPTPDKSIEDLYAKVRKKSKRSYEYSESSDDEVTFIVDDDKSPPQRDSLAVPNLDKANVIENDRAIHEGQHEQVPRIHVQPPLSEENSTHGERNGHVDVQAGGMSKQPSQNTHML